MNVPQSNLREQIAAAFQVPPQLLGITTGGSASLSGSTTNGFLEVEVPETVSRYEHVFRFVSGSAWAVTPEVLAVIKDMLSYRIAGHRLTDSELADRIGSAAPDRMSAARRAPTGVGQRRGGGAVALMSLYGVIAPRASMVRETSGPSGTGLDAFSSQLADAVNDPEVGSIVIDVNSPGGTVDMVPETAAKIRDAKATKPVYAVANTDAGSAAYWLASQATEVIVTPSGMVGSIGVYSMHQDVSVRQELEGKRTTLISAGKFKVEGNPFQALSEEARSAIQSMVNEYYDWFVADVAKGRGVKSSVVSAGYGEGRMLTAKAALEAGLVDRIDTLEGVVNRALGGGGKRRGASMSAADVTVEPIEAEENAPEVETESAPIDHYVSL